MKAFFILRVNILLFTFIALVCMSSQSVAQLHWAKQLSGNSVQQSIDIAIDAAGNVYTLGYFHDTIDLDPGAGTHLLFAAGYEPFVSKLDAAGNFVWGKQLARAASVAYGFSLAVDAAGNVYVTGTFTGTPDFDPGNGVFLLSNQGGIDVFIVKLTTTGDFVWAKQLAGPDREECYSIAVDAQQNVYTTGVFRYGSTDFDPGPGTYTMTSAGEDDIFISKLNAAGDFVWARQIGGTSDEDSSRLALDSAGEIYLAGEFQDTTDLDPGAGTFNLFNASIDGSYTDIFFVKLDTAGTFVWGKHVPGTHTENVMDLVVDDFGNVILAGNFKGTVDFDPGSGVASRTVAGAPGYVDIFITTLDATGNFRWVAQLGGPSPYDHVLSIAVDHDGSIYTTGVYFGTTDFDPGAGTYNLFGGPSQPNGYVAQLDAAGRLVTAKTIWQSSTALAVDDLQRVYIAGGFGGTLDFDLGPGKVEFTSAGNFDVFIVKLTVLKPFLLQGNVMHDVNANCTIDTPDVAMRPVLIKAQPGDYYGLSDQNGDYVIYLHDTGNYTIRPATTDPLWQFTCDTVHHIHLAGTPDTTAGLNFTANIASYCPRLGVDVGVAGLSRCFRPTHYIITYSNTGTLPAQNVSVEVDFGVVTPQSSTLPWTTVAGGVYTFPLGNLAINQQGSFTVSTLFDCAIPLNSTLCVTAHIYPDTLCIAPPAGWDKSETRVTGSCENDSLVCFTIRNRSAAGSGDMSGAAQWRLYINDTLVTQGTYQLAGQDSLVKCFPANGKTYRLEADQHAPHPGNSQPRAFVEACGNGNVDLGFVNNAAQDDADPFIETVCTQVVASFDPNDKQVTPAGITANHYITADDELEYLIRFQNTGNDTAFKVVIRDTLATEVLDVTTLVSGASSHNYVFDISGQGIAEWTFNNILLPDSNVDEAGSHGFVRFKISQHPNNADGVRIENRAAIYFDFNAPVITNYAWNEVNEGAMPASLLATQVSVTDVTCSGGNDGHATVLVTGGMTPYQYQWSSGLPQDSLHAGTYLITVTDVAGSVIIDSFVVADGYQIDIGNIAGTDSADIKQPAIYSVNAGLSYTWTVTNGTITAGQGTNSIEVDWNAVGQGTVQVVATAQGCSDSVSKTITLVDVTGVQDVLYGVALYPNPTDNIITLTAAQVKTSATFTLCNMAGKVLERQTVTPAALRQGVVFDLAKMDAGVYLLYVKTERETRVLKVARR